MSGLLATTQPVTPERFRRARACLQFLGGDVEADWHDAGVSMAVTRKAWETGADFSGESVILRRNGITVVADATIYDRTNLIADLARAGVRPDVTTPTELIWAAYVAWGERLVDRLNGDYAFVIWDAPRRRLLAARDLTGSRPLFYTQRGGRGVSVGSSARAIAVLRDSADVLNLATLGAQIGGVPWGLGLETAYDEVLALLPAHLLVADGDRVCVERFWHPPLAPARKPMKVHDAEVVLRDLLRTAVSDRLSAETTAVFMSGGWDSTAVYAAGQDSLDATQRGRFRPVSISYPPGDPGREDELIDLVADHWGADVHWLRIDEIPLLDGLAQRAARSDQPPVHLFELMNRQLARGARATGARVAFDGFGGDQLFQVSEIVLADLVRSGRWVEAFRLGRARRKNWREFVRMGILPLLPSVAFDALDAITGREVRRHYLERRAAPWMRDEFVHEHSLLERDRSLLRGVRGGSPAQKESVLYLTLPVWSCTLAYLHGALLDEGIENRSPLLDRRIVDFALTRPIHERADAFDTKVLLRGAMRDLLPPAVLARRSHRTGIASGYSQQRMREEGPRLIEQLFAQPLRLADLGMVEPGRLRKAAERACAGTNDGLLRINVFQAMSVELWLRGLDGRSDTLDRPIRSSHLDFSAAKRRDLRGPVARSPLQGVPYVSET